MPERILRLHNHGVVTDLTHLTAQDSIELEFSDPTDSDPIEWVNIHVRSSALPALVETRDVDVDADNTPGPMFTDRTMEPREANPDEPEVVLESDEDISDEARTIEEEVSSEPEPDLVMSGDEITVEELKGLLRDKGLPTSGTKADLIARINGYDAMNVVDLKALLKHWGMPTNGTKAELIERLATG